MERYGQIRSVLNERLKGQFETLKTKCCTGRARIGYLRHDWVLDHLKWF